MLKVKVGYPKPEDEKKVVANALDKSSLVVRPVATPSDLMAMRAAAELIYLDEQVRNYCLALVQATRDPSHHGLKELAPLITWGASPRASIALALGARALAFLDGAGFVTPQHVKDIAPDILRHRVILSYEAEAEGIDAATVVAKLLAAVPVP